MGMLKFELIVWVTEQEYRNPNSKVLFMKGNEDDRERNQIDKYYK